MACEVESALRSYTIAIGKHFKIYESELDICLDDFTERVSQASSGDIVASKKLLSYLRSCLLGGKAPDKQVAQWAARCLFEVTHHGISADKAFSLVTETGRPPNGGNRLTALLTWESIEAIRSNQGLNKTEAIAAYHEQLISLAETLWETSRERIKVEAITTLTRQYRQGARIVKQYIEETGQEPPPF